MITNLFLAIVAYVVAHYVFGFSVEASVIIGMLVDISVFLIDLQKEITG